ncbi:hypothetical protein BDN72DRAFT_723748, partial [Pluteus cervinus]
EYFPCSGTVLSQKKTFIDRFNMDDYANARLKNIHYPFSDEEEWQFGSLLMRSNLSMATIDEMLSLRLIRRLDLSFKTAKSLRSLVELLPQGPVWKSIPIRTRQATKQKLHLYYRNPLQCIEAILQNPLVTDYISYSPVRVYRSAQKTVRVYSEWLSGSAAWEMQELLPKDATLLGMILSSDKTNITAMTGNRLAHPLLISLANLDLDFRSKSSNNAYLLLSLLPIPKFTDPAYKTLFEARLIHRALDFILEDAKRAAKVGYIMDDAFGRRRVHPRRTRVHTLQRIREAGRKAHPWQVQKYMEETKALRISGVHKPFWRNWSSPPLADPANFINPDPLHHWHKAFYDHDLKWCIAALGEGEIDHRFSILHNHTGFRPFPDGISHLQQSTMRENRDLQRYIVAVIAGAVESRFLIAIRALCDVRYRAQSLVLDDDDLHEIDNSLKEFHQHRDAIIASGARTVQNWYIPKFETLLNITRCTRSSGVPIGFSTERTENEHINIIKRPSKKTNNRDYEPQLCRNMDRGEKIRTFEIATEIRAAAVDLGGSFTGNSNNGEYLLPNPPIQPVVSSTKALLEEISPTVFATKRSTTDYFKKARDLVRPPRLPPPGPLRTIVVENTAIHLKQDSCYIMTLDKAAQKFQIPDLGSALAHYMEQAHRNPTGPYIIGGHRLRALQPLPFKRIAIWTKVQLQNKTFHPPYSVMPATTVNASMPDESWPAGRFDPVIINTSKGEQWPYSGLPGHCVAQLCLIMLPIRDSSLDPPLPPSLNIYLTYSRRFDTISQLNPKLSGSRTHRGPYPDPTTNLIILRRARRANGEPMGDIIPIRQLRALVNLVPKFGSEPDNRLTQQTSLAYSDEFYLNKYFTKQMFFSLT